jgi:hypothetical protein
MFSNHQNRRTIMVTRLFTASALALGFMSAFAFAGDNAAYRCDGFLPRNAALNDCGADAAQTSSVKPFAIPEVTATFRGAGPVGDYVDETPAESRQRSGDNAR